jgi:diguanylate cyclase (GGDEF)-like protein
MLEVLVVCTAVLIGLLGGWWLRGNNPRIQAPRSRDEDALRAREMLDRLRELTQHVAADVDQHKALMGRINDELHASEERQPTTVLNALDKLIESNERMQQQLQSAEAKLATQAQQLVSHAAEARTDPLTMLANRRVFDQGMEEALLAMRDHGALATILMLDVDHFKALNDNYGHQAGDAVLRGVAGVLRQQIPAEFLVTRYGGEEFAVVLPSTTLDKAQAFAERVRQTLGETTHDFDGLKLRVTVSIGLAQLQTGDTSTSVVGRADEALYAAKQQGRNLTCLHDGLQVLRVRVAPPVEPKRSIASPPPKPEPGISSPEVFSSDIRRRMGDWHSGGSPLCVLFVQVDELKEIREEGDDENAHAAMRALTLSLKAAMREIDHAARFEGDTLSLLLPGCTMRGAVTVAERLRAAAARCMLPKRYTRRQFTISVGVAEALAHENEDSLIERVRTSLDAARLHGRNCTYLHDGVDLHLIGVGQQSIVQQH